MSGSSNVAASNTTVSDHIKKRLKGGKVYGVPYSVIALSDYEKVVPAEVFKTAREHAREKLRAIPAPVRMAMSLDEDSMTKKMIWARRYNSLSKAEREFFENKVDVITDEKRGGISLGPFSFGKETAEGNARKLFSQVGMMRMMNPGLMDMAYMPVEREEVQKGMFAHEQGKGRFKDRKGAVIIFDKEDDHPEQALGRMLGFKNGEMAPLNGDPEDFYALVLEHELAHVSGAGEAQADAMSAVQYMRLTGRDDMVRYFADFRAVSAVWTEVMLQGAEDKAATADRGFFGLKGWMRDKLLGWQRQMSNRYGWGCVEALDEQVKRGVLASNAMSEAEIHDLRFKSYAGDKWPLKMLGELINKHTKSPFAALPGNLARGFNRASFSLPDGEKMAEVARFCASLKDINDPRLADIRKEYKQDVLDVAQRFTLAASNILTVLPKQGAAPVRRFRLV